MSTIDGGSPCNVAHLDRPKRNLLNCAKCGKRYRQPAQGDFSATANTLYFLGDFTSALAHLEQGMALYDPDKHANPQITRGVGNRGEGCLSQAAFCLVALGYPDQAYTRIQEALTLSRALTHPYSLAYTLLYATMLHEDRGEVQASQERAEEFLALVTEHGFAGLMGHAVFGQGRALVMQGQGDEGLVLMHRGLAAFESTGTKLGRTAFFGYLADAYRQLGRSMWGCVCWPRRSRRPTTIGRGSGIVAKENSC